MKNPITQLSDFAIDTLEGLASNPKSLSSKYFYDDRGSAIFQDIMRMPEYYLTDCELEIFQTHKNEILQEFKNGGAHFEVLELGAGDGLKTKVLLSHFVNQQIDFTYSPIDISGLAVNNLVDDLRLRIPGLKVNGLIGDYFNMLSSFKNNGSPRKVALFLGSNIGNLTKNQSVDFLSKLKESLNQTDQLFIGFDLKKRGNIILDAYNDKTGHTSAFNLNLLTRINRELKADFILDHFYHQEFYDEYSGRAESFLISTTKHEVTIEALDRVFNFEKEERIFMEMSQKYDIELIQELAEKSGFEIVRNFVDKRQYFMNSLWKLKN